MSTILIAISKDSHHYITTWYSHSPLAAIRRLDNILQYFFFFFVGFAYLSLALESEKWETITERGDTLMVIPCWWDGAGERLTGILVCKLIY
jgi:hypothetical protein